jgi:hypothetical protein
VAIICAALLAAWLLVFSYRNLGHLAGVVVGFAVAVAGGWWLITERPPRRWIGLAGTVAGLAIAAVAFIDTAADADYPFLLYGTDWLAFAHLVIAVAFYGPYRDPVRNVWVVEFAMIACAGIVPLALICGPIRGIPFWWTVIDMSFGVIGVIPLYVVRQRIKRLEALTTTVPPANPVTV